LRVDCKEAALGFGSRGLKIQDILPTTRIAATLFIFFRIGAYKHLKSDMGTFVVYMLYKSFQYSAVNAADLDGFRVHFAVD
jgi:hypothetical protein